MNVDWAASRPAVEQASRVIPSDAPQARRRVSGSRRSRGNRLGRPTTPKSANLLADQQVRRPTDKMIRLQGGTYNILADPRVAALFHPRKVRRAGQPSQLFAPKEALPVTISCSRCDHTGTLKVAGAAYCQPWRQPMRPRRGGGKRRERAQHATNPHEPRPVRRSNRPIMNTAGGVTCRACP